MIFSPHCELLEHILLLSLGLANEALRKARASVPAFWVGIALLRKVVPLPAPAQGGSEGMIFGMVNYEERLVGLLDVEDIV